MGGAIPTSWELRTSDPADVQRLSAALGVTELVARLLANRGLTDVAEARRFLSPRLAELPDPFLMKGMDVAVDRILAAIDGGENICVWGDYDVDGVTSASQLIWFFRAIGVEVTYFVPDRFIDGYGLNGDHLASLADDGVGLFVTVDCGISNAAEVEIARAHGADVIVVDHHKIPPEVPRAVAVLNPLQEDCGYPDKRLAACGVAWVLLLALRKRMRDGGRFAELAEPDLREWMDLTAIGTVADMVPLLGVNRIITKYGLPRVEASAKPGVQALCEVSALKAGKITAGTVGFHLGPRINAAGRMAHASAGVELMTTLDVDEAKQIAVGVDRYNLERREVQQTIFEDACALIEAAGDPSERRSIVLAQEGWHTGVLGIVASKVVDRYYRPTILLAIEDGIAKGSARSIPGFKLVDHMRNVDGLLAKYGGHDYAAGLTLDAANVAAFVEAFEAQAAGALSAERLIRRLRMDAEVPLSWVGHPLIADTQRLAPFGQGNPEPTYMARDVHVFEARLVGQDQKHVKLRLAAGRGTIDAIAFGQAEQLPASGSLIDIAYVPELNIFRERATLQVRLKAMRPAASMTTGVERPGAA